MNLAWSLPQQTLRAHCLGLWRSLSTQLQARPLAGPLQALLRRIDALEQFLVLSDARRPVSAHTLLTLGRRLGAADGQDLQLQLLVCCFQLIQQRAEEGERAMQQLRQCCVDELAIAIDAAAMPRSEGLRATRILLAFAAVEVARSALQQPDEEALVCCLRQVQDQVPQVLQQWLGAQVRQVQAALRATDWEPGSAAHKALTSACRRLHALVMLTSRPVLLAQVAAMEIQLQCAHLLRQAPADAELSSTHAWLWQLYYQLNPDSADDRGALNTELAPLPRCLLEGLQGLQASLAQTGADTPVTPQHLARSYELAVVATQLELSAPATLLRCLHALLAAHWNHPETLSSQQRANLAQIHQCLFAGSPAVQTLQLRRALYCLAELWPRTPSRTDLPIPLADRDGCMSGCVRLAAVPALLATGLPVLHAATQAWFADQQAFAQHQLALQRELMLLERGAAAVKVRVVEQLCSHLLELLMNLDLPGALEHFPGALLWRAHQHLLHLLDAAAAWWEMTPDRQLLAALREQGPQLTSTLLAGMIAEPEAGADADAEVWATVRQRLLAYVQSFAAVLEVQVRLDISGDGATWPAASLQRLHAALLPLLRYLLLEFSLALESRRERHLPLTGCLWLNLRRESAALLRAELRDDAVRDPPGTVPWQQLRHRLHKSGVVNASCEPTPLGRCFILNLAPEPDS